ncbi:MAG: epimerase, partial [Fibrobacteria bacterium]
ATENALLRLFKNAYMYRPGMMKAMPGQKHLKSWYRYLAWIYPIGRALFPASFCTLREVALSMIHAASKGYPKRILEVADIVASAKS